MNEVKTIYEKLFRQYGPQGWWPIGGKYHESKYGIPENEQQVFEVCLGAILAQYIDFN